MASGGPRPQLREGKAGDDVISGNLNIAQGGRSIDYKLEDPYVRKTFKEALAQEGVEFTMPD